MGTEQGHKLLFNTSNIGVVTRQWGGATSMLAVQCLNISYGLQDFNVDVMIVRCRAQHRGSTGSSGHEAVDGGCHRYLHLVSTLCLERGLTTDPHLL